jgi:cytosol alanyl aminopeptidase
MKLRMTCLVILAGCATPHASEEKPQAKTTPSPGLVSEPTRVAEPIPTLRLPSDVRPTHYALEMTIDPNQPTFSGTVAIDVTLSAPRDVLWLHGLDLKVHSSSVKVGEQSLPAVWDQVNDDGVARLTLPHAIGPGPATILVAWSRAYDPRLLGLYLAHEAGVTYAFTQFEDIHARKAFPSFDEPGFKTPFDVTLVVPNDAVAVANTPENGQQPAGASKRLRFATTKPLPTYLLAWAVGPFDVVDAPTLPPNAIRSWPVPMRGIAPKGRGGEMGFALKTARELLLREEEYFGVPFAYPKLDSVAVPDYAFGAMENAGEIHYREDLLLFKDGVTADLSKLEMANVIAHEQAHQWFGDLVTMPWWEDAWLNESFATWLATRMVQAWKPEWNASIDLQKSVNRVMRQDALVTARAIRQPLTSVKNIQDQFDGLTYQKGGAVLAMFERSMGAEPFRRGVSAYIAAHANGSGSTDDLLAALSKSAGRDIATPFHTFLDQAGVPLVQAKVSCAAGKGTLTLSQSRFFPLGSTGVQDRTWQIPVCTRYGTGAKTTEVCTLLTKAQDTVALPSCPDWVLPNADGAGYYRWSVAGDDLKKLRTAGYSKLNIRERISLAQSLNAGVAAGSIPFADALAALEPITRDSEGEVVTEILPLLRFAGDHLVPANERVAYESYTSSLFAPVVARVGYTAKKNEPTSTTRLRGQVLNTLAHANDSAVVAQLSKQARAYAGLTDGQFHPEAIDPDLAEVALVAAVEHGDVELFDALDKRLNTLDDGDLRERVIGALSSARDPEHAARGRALTLDARLRKQEAVIPLFGQTNDERTRAATWEFIKGHFEAVVQAMPENYAAYLPLAGNGFCDDGKADEINTFFAPVVGKHNGMSQNMRQATEFIRLCAAEVAAQRASAHAFFEARTAGKVKTPPSR